ncbi:hypothetical protein [Sphingosinicella sp.]|uniref:hypothetical protein n=1 Tax=Sphingosinicella sp. TaxID=1917971 RepID=UPI004037C2A2
MTHQPPSFSAAPADDPGNRIAQLREALALVERLAGRQAQASDAGLDEAATISAGHDRAPPIVRRRFDALAAESAVWTASGVEALLAAGENPSRAAAARLAGAIRATLAEMRELVS